MKQSKVAWIECMCSEICCFGSARCSKVVRSPYNARELFCDISLHGMRTQSQITINGFCSLGPNIIFCLHLQGYDKIE